MNVTTLKFSTDLDRGVQMTPLRNAFLTGDQQAHRLEVACTHAGVPADLTGWNVNGYFIRADGATLPIRGGVEKGAAVVTLPAACYAVAGRFSFVIKVSNGEAVSTVLWVEGAVSPSTTGVTVDPGEVIPTLEELMARIDDMEKATADAKDAAASITTYTQEVRDLRTDVDGQAYPTAAAAALAHQISRTKLISDDLNNYTEPMWGVVSGSAANAPCNQSGVVINTRSNVGTGWLVQQYFSAYDAQTYWRTLRVNHAGSDWSPWHSSRRADYGKWIPAGDSLRDVIEDDFYFAMCDKAALDTPPGTTTPGMLLLLPFSSGVNLWHMQLWISTDLSSIHARMHHQGDWTTWAQLWRYGSVKPKKKIVFMGDSILGNNQSSTGVVNQFASLTGNECHNFAMGGTRARDTRVGWKAWEAETLCQAIVTGDFTAQLAALSTASSVPTYFANTLAAMQAFDFSTCDVLVINWGTNDWRNGNTYEEYYEALMTFITTMQAAFPRLRIVKMTPTQRFDDQAGTVICGNTWQINGSTLQDFVEQESRISHEANIPVLDMYNLGINIHNYLYFISDMTHHNERGRRLIAEKLAMEVI